jgi:hypothetical protein
LAAPPPAPRDVPNGYTWRLLLTSGWAITAGVFSLLGFIFFLLGLILTLVFTLDGLDVPVGPPFMAIGLALLIIGVPIFLWRYGKARQMTKVFRLGEATSGNIITVRQNRSVRVNRRHPWIITYQFRSVGREYSGQHTTLNDTGVELTPGQLVYILYLQDNPEWNILYL